ncbi:MAG: hypothetical protein MJZ81_09350 [Bacteroidales bacterium]|nr:hypothetical protein [Bacteroidales bacterium]
MEKTGSFYGLREGRTSGGAMAQVGLCWAAPGPHQGRIKVACRCCSSVCLLWISRRRCDLGAALACNKDADEERRASNTKAGGCPSHGWHLSNENRPPVSLIDPTRSCCSPQKGCQEIQQDFGLVEM